MNKIVVLILVMSIAFFRAVACLNGETAYLKDGTFLFEDGDSKVPEGHARFDQIRIIL